MKCSTATFRMQSEKFIKSSEIGFLAQISYARMTFQIPDLYTLLNLHVFGHTIHHFTPRKVLAPA